MQSCVHAVKWIALALALGLGVPAERAAARPPFVPPAMLEACRGLKEGAPCRFELDKRWLEGTCAPLPDSELACRPRTDAKRPPPRPAPAPAPAPNRP